MNSIVKKHASSFNYIAVLVVVVAAISAAAVVPVHGSDSESVSATVTIQHISLSVSDGIVEYGTLAEDDTLNTTAGGTNDTQTATAEGNVDTDLNILGADTANWTLASTAGSDEYTHSFSTDTGSTWTNLTLNAQTLATGVSPSGAQDFDLEIGTPTTSSTTDEQNADVVVQAVASN